jgi:hypothetical protein
MLNLKIANPKSLIQNPKSAHLGYGTPPAMGPPGCCPLAAAAAAVAWAICAFRLV